MRSPSQLVHLARTRINLWTSELGDDDRVEYYAIHATIIM